MKNYTKKLNKFTAILIMTLFLGSMFYFNPENTLTNLSEELQVNEQTNNNAIPVNNQDVSTLKQSTVDYDTWYSDGPSVKTDIEFNIQGVDYELSSWTSNYAGSSYGITQLDFMNSYVDDANVWKSYIQWGSAVSALVDFSVIHRIYCGGEGDIHYDFRCEWLSGALNSWMTDWTSGTKAVDSSDLDAQGYLYLEFYMYASPTIDKLICYIYMHTTTGRETVGFVQKLSCTDPSVASLTFNVDYIYFQRDTITNNVRSTYNYASPTTITFAVNPPGVAFSKEQNIYYSSDEWSYSSITPTASVTDTGGVLTINSPTEIDYEIFFTSNCSNHLAIKDVSTSYFDSVGFEGGTYQNDFSEQSGYEWDSMSISTEKVFEGYYSVELENTGASRSIIWITALEERILNFYFQISVYYETVTSGSLYIYYKDDSGTWTSHAIDNTILNSWQTLQIFVSDAAYNGEESYFRIDTLSGTNFEGKAYIDNIKILETSTTIKTTQSSESIIDFAGALFDGYKFAQDSFRDYQVEIWDRCDQTLEYSYSVTTDEFGHGTVIHPYAFEQKEYEIRAYTIDSYFSGSSNWVDTEEKTESLTGWSAGSGASLSLETSNVQEGDNAIKNLRDSGTYSYLNPRYDPSTSWSIKNIDYFFFYVYRYCSSSIDSFLINIETAWDRYFTIDVKDQCPTDQTWYLIRIATSDLGVYGTPDASVIDNIYFRMSITTSLNDYLLIDDLKAVHSPKLYFTPSNPTETDFLENHLNDPVDFSEGDKDTSYTKASSYFIGVQDGYISYYTLTGETYSAIYGAGKNNLFDYNNYYDTGIIRIRVNDTTDSPNLYFGIHGNSLQQTSGQALTTSFQIYVFDLSSFNDDTNAFVRITLDQSGLWTTDLRFDIDYVKLVHIDDPVLIETDTNFYLSSVDNDYSYDVYLDENYLGVYTDLQTILKNNTVGAHNLTYVLFSAGEEKAYLSSTYEYLYTVDSASFSVSVENFYLSDLYVNTFVTANFDGTYIVYEDTIQIDSGTLYKDGTTIITNRDLTPGTSINYTIAFTYDSEMVAFKTYYNNPSSDFFVTSYSVDIATTITVTWGTSKNSIDSLTIIEDGVEKVTDDSASPTTWTKSTVAGEHVVTLLFEATDYADIIYSFVYTVAVTEDFQVNIESFYVSDDYVNLYVTSNYDYSYSAYTNTTLSGSGNGLSEGTFIIIPKYKEAGIFNLTVAFEYGAETVLFMTWYSNLIPPPEPVTDIYREQSEGYFNITLMTNLDYFWIDIYHDGVLIYDDSTLTEFAILKDTKIGYHFVQLVLIYNCTTNSDGYPVAEYNQTITYPIFYYETVLFYDCQIRYTEKIYGIAIPEIEVDSVLTYLDGILVDTLNYTSVIQDHSNYSYILNNRLWIHNSARNHTLVVRDLFDNLIYNTTIDIGIIQSMTIELPLEKLYVINLDDDDRLIKIRPYLSGLDWDTDADDLITMILGQYEQKSYWLIDSTYECRIYKKVETVSDGVVIWYWVHDPSTEPPPERVPFSIEIELQSDDDDDDGDKTWWDKVVAFFVQYWFYIAVVVLLLVILIGYNAIGNAIVKKQEEQIRQNKKTSLMVQTILQLGWAKKYERLKGFERGKEK